MSKLKMYNNISTNTISTCDDFADNELESFVHSYPYLEFRRYKSVDRKSDKLVLLKTIIHEVEKARVTYTTRINNELTGIAILSQLDWETQFFEQPMLTLRMHVRGENRQKTAKVLMRKILELSHISHNITISLPLDAEDFDVRFVAEQSGFQIMDSVCSYEHHSCFSAFPKTLKQRFHVRNYEPSDHPSVLAVAERCFDGYKNRIFLDPNLGPEQAKRFYMTWTEKCCTKEMADQLLVAEYRNRVIGFLGWRLHNDLHKYTSLRLHGRGLGGFLPTRCNAYKELLWHAVGSLGGEPADFDTHLFNIAAINAYQQLGFRYVRARHILHFWR